MLVLDRADFPRDKPCGDGIAYEVTGELRRLGFDIDRVFAGIAPVSGLALRSPAGVRAHRRLRDPVHVVPRRIFDARLVGQLAGLGIELRRQAVRTLEVRADGVCLDGRWHARVVIGADGAESAVRRGAARSRVPAGGDRPRWRWRSAATPPNRRSSPAASTSP